MSAEKPLPCPFCRSDVTPMRYLSGKVIVGCSNSECLVTCHAISDTEEDAIRRWNARQGEGR